MIKYLRSAYILKKFYLYNYGNHKEIFYIKDVLKIIFKISNKTLEKIMMYLIFVHQHQFIYKKCINLINKYSKKPKIIKKDRILQMC